MNPLKKEWGLPVGIRHVRKAQFSERGANQGKSRFVIVCPSCPEGSTRTANQSGADLTHPPTHCPKGHSFSHVNGWPR